MMARMNVNVGCKLVIAETKDAEVIFMEAIYRFCANDPLNYEEENTYSSLAYSQNVEEGNNEENGGSV